MENKIGDKTWLCVPCNWFIYPGALEFQANIGIQEYPWTCPGCGGLLVPEEK